MLVDCAPILDVVVAVAVAVANVVGVLDVDVVKIAPMGVKTGKTTLLHLDSALEVTQQESVELMLLDPQ